jgi:hypothetical protein
MKDPFIILFISGIVAILSTYTLTYFKFSFFNMLGLVVFGVGLTDIVIGLTFMIINDNKKAQSFIIIGVAMALLGYFF